MASQWYIKNFKKDEAIKMIYTGSDKRIIIRWLIPENNTITYNNKSYMLHPKKMFIHKGTPTVYINYKDAEPLDVLDKNNQVYTPDDFNTAISSKVGQELFEASKPKGLESIAPIISIASLLGVIYIAYTMQNSFTELRDTINAIAQYLSGGIS
jgi:hypothetical protein|tara:strand:+ start:242 stop:703 length:462 start_codon:yes stop_codon:yes gene_type:complete